MKFNSFQEYCQIKNLASEANITIEQSAILIDEGFLSNFAANIAKKYMLPVGMVMAIISGTGCNGKQCPTPQVTQQIKQEFAKETQNQQVKQQDVVIDGDKFTSVGRAKIGPLGKLVARDMAVMQAQHRVMKALGKGKESLYRTTPIKSSIENGIFTVTIQGFLSQPNDGMNNLGTPEVQPGQVQQQNNGDSDSPRRLP